MFHDYRLVFDGEGGWSYEQIDHEHCTEDHCASNVISQYVHSDKDDTEALEATSA